MPLVVADRIQIQSLDFGSRPSRLAKKSQTAVDARIVTERVDLDSFTQTFPAIFGDQVFEDRLKRDAREADCWVVVDSFFPGTEGGEATIFVKQFDVIESDAAEKIELIGD